MRYEEFRLGGVALQIIMALLLDAVFGDPRGIPHPVAGIGRLISFYEKFFYGSRGAKAGGAMLCAAVLVTVGAAVSLVLSFAAFIGEWAYAAVNIYLLYAAIAFKSLKDESAPVARLLAEGDLEGARRQVGRIVGRDTERLSEGGVVRAAVETIAESYIDGIVSVLFYMALGSLCGQAALFAWLFKAASTMDSMIGYDDERYHDFGYAAAKLDDALNFIPARLGGVIAVAAGALANMDYKRAWRIFPARQAQPQKPEQRARRERIRGAARHTARRRRLLRRRVGAAAHARRRPARAGAGRHLPRALHSQHLGRDMRRPDFRDKVEK